MQFSRPIPQVCCLVVFAACWSAEANRASADEQVYGILAKASEKVVGAPRKFDVERPEGFSLIEVQGAAIPVNRPGSFVAVGSSGDCTISGEAVLARCSVGKGRVVLLADAALLDLHDPHPQAASALGWLARQGFPERGK